MSSVARIPSNVGMANSDFDLLGLLYDYGEPMLKHVRKYAKNEYGGRVAKGPFGQPLDFSEKRKVPKKVSLPNKMPKFLSTVNSLADKASMKRRHSKNAMGRRGPRKIAVPKKLKKQIKQVLTGKMIYGAYKTVRIGTIGCCTLGSLNPVDATKTVLGMTSQIVSIHPKSSVATSYNRSLWYAPLGANATDPAVAASYTSSSAFIFFHPLKYLDAGSILWNNKAINEDWSIQTDNIQTRVSTTAGTPATAITDGLKLNVVDSYVQFTLKNNTKRQVTVTAYHIKSKNKLQKDTVINAWVNALAQDVATNGPVKQYGGSGLNDPLLNPGDSLSFNQNYKYETVSIVMKPGESCTHSIQGLKNTVIDYGKMYQDSTDILDYITKDTVQVLFSVQPDLQTTTSGGFTSGSFMYAPNSTDNTFVDPVTVVYQEVFKLKCPEQAGFIQRAVAAGTGLPLTLKRYCKAFGNFATVNVTEPVTYTGADEQQPGSDIAGGARF